jgi:NAD(P)H-flavin reductase
MKALNSGFVPIKGTLRSIVPMAQDNYLFQISVEDGSLSGCQPGQFIMLWIPGVGEAAISVCSGQVDGTLELCVRKVGRVTSALFQLEEGSFVGLRGPFGHGFPLDEYKGKDLCLIAGGLGVAPIRSLWQYVLAHRENYGKIILIYGMRHSIDLLFRQELRVLLRRHDIDVYIAAEEIVGPDLPPVPEQLGRVTDMIKLAPIDQNFQVAVCGPPVMYQYVIEELLAKNVRQSDIWLSLERHMKCGMGKCGHCFVGGKFACQEGPVFSLLELNLLPEVIECHRK